MAQFSGKPEWDMILSAAQKNLPIRIREMVETQGVNPSHSNAVGQTALHIAALWGNVDSVRVLVEVGANTNAQNNLTGATPLHMVAQSKKGNFESRIEVINILLNAGARPDIADKYGTLPVHSVQLNDDGDITETELDEQTRRLVTLLQPQRPKIYEAISNRSLSHLEQVIVTDGSSVNVVFRGQTPLSLVISELLEVLTSSAKESSNENETILLSMIKLLLNSSADPNCVLAYTQGVASDEPKEPALHCVVCTLRTYYKRTESSEDVDHAISILTEVIHCLLQAEATVPLDTILLLHQAARFNEFRLASLLIDTLHIDPNTRGRQGMTPLQFAARSGQIEMIQFLLKQPKIDVNIKDDRGQTALDAARINGKDDATGLLEGHLSGAC